MDKRTEVRKEQMRRRTEKRMGKVRKEQGVKRRQAVTGAACASWRWVRMGAFVLMIMMTLTTTTTTMMMMMMMKKKASEMEVCVR